MLPVWQFHLRLFYLLNNNTYNHEIIIVYPAATLRSFVEFAFAFVSARVLLIHLPTLQYSFSGIQTLLVAAGVLTVGLYFQHLQELFASFLQQKHLTY